ncbi:hypothetical protein BACCIP111883_01117 [Sutcliffiella rhizosphaerae]|uniref:Uncharacterized protein n=1 Tax=Sutcliffiella rhizosphaerae TaxID=2880967 RepID=A0ABN8A5G7_9BACI|nr:hypothetical protein BACCIP111883_01117 [Sutcliffiella rhizosphaerae]
MLSVFIGLIGYFTYAKTDILIKNVTYPASWEENEAFATGDQEGIKTVKNEDGSITQSMNIFTWYIKKKEKEQEILRTIDLIIESEEHPSIHNISHNEELSNLFIMVDRSTYEENALVDGFVPMLLGMHCAIYQLYNGATLDNYHVKVTVQDFDTKEIINEVLVPW